MPRVKLNTPSDDLNAIKKRINRKNKEKYVGVEAGQPQVREETQQVYNGIADKLNGIVASIGEINAQLSLTAGNNAPWASKAIDRYITATSASKKQIADLNSYLEQNAGSLSNLSEPQLQSISKLQEELTIVFTEIIKSVNKLSPKRQEAIKKVFTVFVDDLVRLNQTLTGNISTSTKKVFSKENGKSTARTIQGIPVNPFKKSVGALPDPEQAEESDAPKPRKTRKDAGTTKAPPSAGGEPKKKIRIKKPTPKTKPPSLSMAEEISGSDADTEGAGYAGDRMVGGLLMRRHMPISFPSVCRKEYNGGSIYLDEANYMPTRFL
jgi:hypothetical protein